MDQSDGGYNTLNWPIERRGVLEGSKEKQILTVRNALLALGWLRSLPIHKLSEGSSLRNFLVFLNQF